MGTLSISAHLVAFANEVRGSTVRRFQQVRAGDWGWRPGPDLLSFGDVLKHLVDADRWLFDRLDGGPPSGGVVIAPGDGDSSACTLLLEELVRLGVERSRRLSALSDQDFCDRRFDLLERGVVNTFQLIVRCNLDHEIHHRGSLQLGLRLRYG
ncbi:MAG: hypothetical protein JWL69_1388 [Phycisphaerales bacterium]|nr:hypothetical protein [Phycisphaerales bacterium]